MTLRHMKILVEVYRQNSVTKGGAGTASVPALGESGAAGIGGLLRRDAVRAGGTPDIPHGVRPEFYGYAVHVVSLMDELETRMRNWDAIGTVRIGATVTIGTYLLPELVRRYQAEFPALHVDVQVCRASQVEQLVLDNRIDLGLIETQPEHEELVAVPFSGTNCRPSCRRVPLAARGKVTIQELAQFPFLMREPGSAGRKALDGYLALHRLSVQPAWESVSTQALIKAVVEGLGVAVLPKLLIQQDVASGNVVPLTLKKSRCGEL